MLDKLEPASHAHYKMGGEQSCLKGTREDLLHRVSEWIHEGDPILNSSSSMHPRLFWLYGMAGSGKSSVANSVADIVNTSKNHCLSCFFCKRDDPSLSNPQTFFPTLAYRIAQHYAEYRAALVNLLGKPKGAAILTGGLTAQFRLLFTELISQVTAPNQRHVVVIDALDECGRSPDQCLLATCMVALVRDTPWIKIFVTSRPETSIRSAFDSPDATDLRLRTALNINDDKDTDTSIRSFIIKQLEITQVTLDSDEISQLVQQASGLFIWASTVFKQISKISPRRDLRRFLHGDAPREPIQQLYALYDQIVKNAVSPENSEDVAMLHTILGLIYVAASNRPLSTQALSRFLCADPRFQYEDENSVQKTIRALHAVLYEDTTRNMRNAVRVLHPSFLDYLQVDLNKPNSFPITTGGMHELMFKSCMVTMDAELRFNICKLDDSSLLNKDVPSLDKCITEFITEALEYSVLYWFMHLSGSSFPLDRQAFSSISTLLGTPKALFWLEVLSLIRALRHGADVLREATTFFQVSGHDKLFPHCLQF